MSPPPCRMAIARATRASLIEPIGAFEPDADTYGVIRVISPLAAAMSAVGCAFFRVAAASSGCWMVYSRPLSAASRKRPVRSGLFLAISLVVTMPLPTRSERYSL